MLVARIVGRTACAWAERMSQGRNPSHAAGVFWDKPKKTQSTASWDLLSVSASSISDLPGCYVVDHFWLYRRFQIQLQLSGPTFEFAFVLVSSPAVFES